MEVGELSKQVLHLDEDLLFYEKGERVH